MPLREKDHEHNHNEKVQTLTPELQAFYSELAVKFPKIRVTDGKREASQKVGKNYRTSKHNTGEAFDISAQDKDVADYLMNDVEGAALLTKYGLGLLDETNPETIKKTGATGPHYHIGKDPALVQKAMVRYETLSKQQPKQKPQPITLQTQIQGQPITTTVDPIQFEKEVQKEEKKKEKAEEKAEKSEARKRLEEKKEKQKAFLDALQVPNSIVSYKQAKQEQYEPQEPFQLDLPETPNQLPSLPSMFQMPDVIKQNPNQEQQFMEDGGKVVSKLWEEKTGTNWAEAKKQGLTDGSYESNMKLRNELENSFEKFNTKISPTLTTKPATKQEVSEISSAEDFNTAFTIARTKLGTNKIFEWKGRKYGTNMAGEVFNPSEIDLAQHGLNTPTVKKRLETENTQVISPYSSKKTTKLEKDKYKDWESVKSKTIEINKMNQADIIVNYKNSQKTETKNYAVIDKKKGLLHIYQPGNTTPLFTSAIDLGENKSDAQTTTKIKDKNADGVIDNIEAVRGKADFSKGNKSTGAGKYYISNIDAKGYGGLPLLNMMNEKQYEDFKRTGKVNNVATSFHKGYISDDTNRVSNGCIRCNKTTLDNLTKYLQNTSEVYILPEEKGNEFKMENGKLNFKANAKSPFYTYKDNGKVYKKEGDKWFVATKENSSFTEIKEEARIKELSKNATNAGYNFYQDSNGSLQKGQGVNRGNTLNYVPIKVKIDESKFKDEKFTYFDFSDDKEFENVKKFTQSLQDNKQNIMKAAQINGDVYNDIVKVAFGIFGVESNFADTHSAIGNLARATGKFFDPKGSSSPDYKSKYDTYGAKGSNQSVGLIQARWSNFTEKEKEVLKKLGIKSNEDFMDPKKAAIAVTSVLAVRYNQQLNDKQKQNLEEYLPKTWNSRENYADRVKESSKYIKVSQKQ
jgi:hypothetical protein